MKDRIAELKKDQEEARERRKEALAEKDSLAKGQYCYNIYSLC